MTNDKIGYMVNQFLRWRLPEDFNPDAGITFKRVYNEGTPYEGIHRPTGTNLFNYEQALEMVYNMVNGLD